MGKASNGTKKAWHDTADLGVKLKRVFDKVEKKSKGASDIQELTSLANSMGHTAMQIVNIKKQNETETKLERIERLLEHVPKEVLAQAMVKANANK